jgi:glycosyltransferase involved in cell wall biosynthesis
MQMPSPSQVHVVIAAYNEAAVISRVVSEIRCAGYAVVVVDDGSKDQTADIALGRGAALLRHPFNLGQGAALQTGIDYAAAMTRSRR